MAGSDAFTTVWASMVMGLVQFDMIHAWEMCCWILLWEMRCWMLLRL